MHIKKFIYVHAFALILSLLSPHNARAQVDEERSLPWEAGGIRLENSDGLSIENLELHISPFKIEAKYAFKNNKKNALTTKISFNVPPYPYKNLHKQVFWDMEILEEVLATHARNNSWTLERPKSQNIPFINFSAAVNNKTVSLRHEERATRCGSPANCPLELTQILRNNGLPLSPILASCIPIGSIVYSDDKCTERHKTLKRLKLLDANNEPLWNKSVTYSWNQQFNPGGLTEISHTYRPATGFFVMRFDEDRPPLESFAVGILNAEDLLSNCCYHRKLGLSQDLIQWIAQKFTQDINYPNENKGSYMYIIDYNLSDLKTWLKDNLIKKFKITIEHPKGGTIQTCPLWSQMRFSRLTETTVSAETKNYIPQTKLRLVMSAPYYVNNEAQ